MIDSFSNSELEIDIIGQGSKKEELASLAKVKNTKVNFLGTLSNEELLKIFRIINTLSPLLCMKEILKQF